MPEAPKTRAFLLLEDMFTGDLGRLLVMKGNAKVLSGHFSITTLVDLLRMFVLTCVMDACKCRWVAEFKIASEQFRHEVAQTITVRRASPGGHVASLHASTSRPKEPLAKEPSAKYK